MPLLKDGRVIDDPWRHLDDAESLPEGAPATVSLRRWSAERGALSRRNGRIGLRLPNDAIPLALAEDVARFDLIALSFPRFTDGRAYSQARLLRSRLGFRGELRATGDVLRDQLMFMRRCGIDAFEVGDRALAENWLAALGEFDDFYQPAEDGRPWIARRRASEDEAMSGIPSGRGSRHNVGNAAAGEQCTRASTTRGGKHVIVDW